MTKHTRSVSFATTSQVVLFCKDDKTDTWYSQDDDEQFRLTMAEDVQRLRASITTAQPRHLSKDDFDDCNGIEVYILFSEDIQRRLRDMKRAYRRTVLASQSHFSPVEFSRVLQQRSYHARQHAVTLAVL